MLLIYLGSRSLSRGETCTCGSSCQNRAVNSGGSTGIAAPRMEQAVLPPRVMLRLSGLQSSVDVHGRRYCDLEFRDQVSSRASRRMGRRSLNAAPTMAPKALISKVVRGSMAVVMTPPITAPQGRTP